MIWQKSNKHTHTKIGKILPIFQHCVHSRNVTASIAINEQRNAQICLHIQVPKIINIKYKQNEKWECSSTNNKVHNQK